MKVGLIISGGGGKGAYQLGALKAINEYFDQEDFAIISAASIGFVNAYCYFSDKLDYALDMWKSINNLSKNILVTSVVKSPIFKNSIDEIINNGQLRCASLNFPLLDIKNRKLDYYNICEETDKEKIKLYISASISIPIINRSVIINGKYYIDGAVAETMPLRPFEAENIEELDYIICLYFDKEDKNFIAFQGKPNNFVIPICFDDDTRIINAVSLSEKNIEAMITRGYETTKKAFSVYLANGKDDVEYVRTQINNERYHAGRPLKKFSVTTILRYINKITKLFIKK